MTTREGKQTGKGLKSGLNMADTGSVVHTATSKVVTGTSKACAPTGAGHASKNMQSANASRKS